MLMSEVLYFWVVRIQD